MPYLRQINDADNLCIVRPYRASSCVTFNPGRLPWANQPKMRHGFLSQIIHHILHALVGVVMQFDAIAIGIG